MQYSIQHLIQQTICGLLLVSENPHSIPLTQVILLPFKCLRCD